jgi:alanine-glyoxylate transaminase/serine-glyoxylate transaminase/serine-pyruvate transaminase
MGMRLFAEEGHRLPSLTTVWIPEGADDAAARATLLRDFNLEIGGGLGDVRGKVWRLGLMGHTSTPANLFYSLAAIEQVLSRQGCRVGSGLAAAQAALVEQGGGT